MKTGESSSDIGTYNLPVTDVQEKRRNFSGYQCNTYFNLADMQDGDYAGTTNTSGNTEGATAINKKRS